jgi:hypothetical protein
MAARSTSAHTTLRGGTVSFSSATLGVGKASFLGTEFGDGKVDFDFAKLMAVRSTSSASNSWR